MTVNRLLPPDESGRRDREAGEVEDREMGGAVVGGAPIELTVTTVGGCRTEPNSSARPLVLKRVGPYGVASSEGCEVLADIGRVV